MLEAIGVTPDQERFYLAVLRDQGASIGTICRALGISTQRGTVIASTLEEMGLISRSSGRPQRMLAAPPETGLEPLLLRSQDQLARVGQSIAALSEQHRARDGRRNAHEIIEVVVGTDAVVRRYEQLQRSAREEIRAFVRPPRAQPAGTNRTEIRMLRKGVRFRAIYDSDALRTPGSVDEIAVYQAEGEEARALQALPLKLVVADRSLAIVPLSGDTTLREPGAILVHPSPLLDALVALFDTLWEIGIPLTPVAGEPAAGTDHTNGLGSLVGGADDTGTARTAPSTRLTGDDARILGLLLAGLTDEATARQLGLSVRTVQRRVQRLMTTARVTTRLQLGWHAHLHGWL